MANNITIENLHSIYSMDEWIDDHEKLLQHINRRREKTSVGFHKDSNIQEDKSCALLDWLQTINLQLETISQQTNNISYTQAISEKNLARRTRIKKMVHRIRKELRKITEYFYILESTHLTEIEEEPKHDSDSEIYSKFF